MRELDGPSRATSARMTSTVSLPAPSANDGRASEQHFDLRIEYQPSDVAHADGACTRGTSTGGFAPSFTRTFTSLGSIVPASGVGIGSSHATRAVAWTAVATALKKGVHASQSRDGRLDRSAESNDDGMRGASIQDTAPFANKHLLLLGTGGVKRRPVCSRRYALSDSSVSPA